jgi:hypothetical protein
MAIPLERFAGLAKFLQYEEPAEMTMSKLETLGRAEKDIHPEYVLRLKDAAVLSSEEWATSLGKKDGRVLSHNG